MMIIDSAIWIAFLKKDDSCHELAKHVFQKLSLNEMLIYDHIYSEVMTVLRNRVSEEACMSFKNFFEDLDVPILLVNDIIFMLANLYFLLFKKLSFTDCIMLASSKIYQHELRTFDKNLQKAWEKVRS